jgi:AcrR family transcriptional regulator
MQDSETAGSLSTERTSAARQERFLRTRQELLDAARNIFARDGFDAARLQDIAASAGKTRGAFYAHFKDKEDVFFAIFEQDVERDEQQIAFDLSSATSRAKRIDIVLDHLWNVLQDQRRMLLHLEFKMYAVRQPRRKKRLADLHAAMCMSEPGDEWETLLPEFHAASPEAQRIRSAQCSALLDGLSLTLMFDRGTLNEATVRRQLRAGVAAMLDTKPAH